MYRREISCFGLRTVVRSRQNVLCNVVAPSGMGRYPHEIIILAPLRWLRVDENGCEPPGITLPAHLHVPFPQQQSNACDSFSQINGCSLNTVMAWLRSNYFIILLNLVTLHVNVICENICMF